MTINRNDKSTSIPTQMDSLIPASKILNLTQGMFVGTVSDNFDERIDQKIFHAEIVVDSQRLTNLFPRLPTLQTKTAPIISKRPSKPTINASKKRFSHLWNQRRNASRRTRLLPI